jgi:A/G-specific adenine glycosylase
MCFFLNFIHFRPYFYQMSQQNLLTWYNQNKRDLPWRSTREPYKIWISEIILQQTRVDQGYNYYLKFIDEFPTIKILAEASQEQILKLWQGLGYYSRARNMHQTAKIIHFNLNGKFPENSADLQKLKGIGPYTAAAIASFAFNEAVAVLDGNVFRVLSRIFDENTPINSHLGKKLFSNLAQDFLNPLYPDSHNQAIMELGAMVCKPQNPDCHNCPLQTICLAYQNKSYKSLPIKEKKLKVKSRYLYYMFFEFNGKTLIRKRVSGDIWEGLYDLPCIDSDSQIDEIEIFERISELAPNQPKIEKIFTLKHQLTHRSLFAEFYKIELNHEILAFQDSFWLDLELLKSFPASRLFEKFQQSINLHHS